MIGDFQLVAWKSKETRIREEKEYEKWAFPYGQNQREKITALLQSVFPRENATMALFTYLTCRELYENALKIYENRDTAINKMLSGEKRYKSLISKKYLPLYLAIVLSNEEVDEDVGYPDAETITWRAEQLKKRMPF